MTSYMSPGLHVRDGVGGGSCGGGGDGGGGGWDGDEGKGDLQQHSHVKVEEPELFISGVHNWLLTELSIMAHLSSHHLVQHPQSCVGPHKTASYMSPSLHISDPVTDMIPDFLRKAPWYMSPGLIISGPVCDVISVISSLASVISDMLTIAESKITWRKPVKNLVSGAIIEMDF